jgi:hypothetical protein
MFEVQSFIRKDNNFIQVSEFTGDIPDPDYIDGAIRILCQEQELLSFEDSDYVDQLWAYFVDGLYEIAEWKRFSTHLPDHPTKITFEPNRALKQVSIKVESHDTYSGSVQYSEFMSTMITQGRAFFRQMTKLLPDSRNFYEEMEQRLSSIEWSS